MSYSALRVLGFRCDSQLPGSITLNIHRPISLTTPSAARKKSKRYHHSIKSLNCQINYHLGRLGGVPVSNRNQSPSHSSVEFLRLGPEGPGGMIIIHRKRGATSEAEGNGDRTRRTKRAGI